MSLARTKWKRGWYLCIEFKIVCKIEEEKIKRWTIVISHTIVKSHEIYEVSIWLKEILRCHRIEIKPSIYALFHFSIQKEFFTSKIGYSFRFQKAFSSTGEQLWLISYFERGTKFCKLLLSEGKIYKRKVPETWIRKLKTSIICMTTHFIYYISIWI